MDINLDRYNLAYSCYINLTSKCNLRCKHCFGNYSIPHQNELTLEEWKKVIDDLHSSKVFFVNISGGEPTQSPYFKEFITYLSKKGLHFILTTNGVFSKEVREFISKNQDYLIGIKISLDGPDEKSHCYIRLDSSGKINPDIFSIVLDNISYFKEKQIPLTISTILHKENIKKIDMFFQLIKKINPVSWFISPIIPVGRGNVNKSVSENYNHFDISFWESIINKGRAERININLIDCSQKIIRNGLSSYECAATLNMCEIHSDGTVSPCTLSRICIPRKALAFDNIKEKSLQEIWDGKAFEEFRGYMDKGCNGCKMLPNCNKCIAQSFRYFENGYSPTPYCIKNGEKLGLKKLKSYKDKLNKGFGIKI